MFHSHALPPHFSDAKSFIGTAVGHSHKIVHCFFSYCLIDRLIFPWCSNLSSIICACLVHRCIVISSKFSFYCLIWNERSLLMSIVFTTEFAIMPNLFSMWKLCLYDAILAEHGVCVCVCAVPGTIQLLNYLSPMSWCEQLCDALRFEWNDQKKKIKRMENSNTNEWNPFPTNTH